MPLWAAVLALILCAAGTVQSWRVFIRGGNTFYLSAGIATLVLGLVAFGYIVAVGTVVSSIR